MEPQYEYEGASIHAILADPRVRKALVEGFIQFPDDRKIERIRYLRNAVLLCVKDAKDVVEHVMGRPYLLKEWEKVRREHYYDARAKHGDNKYAIKNSLKKHHYYSEEEAWAVIEEFDPPTDSGVSLGSILGNALKENETKNYMVANLDGDVVLTGQAARDFVASADKLGIHRSAYRLFVEVLP